MKNNKHHPRTSRGLTFGSATAMICMIWLLFTVPGIAVADNFADRTPGDRHLGEGLRAYERGRYSRAMTSFVSAARWADKIAQYNLGVMYLYGQGVDADPARAWAWLSLSAERNYPLMTETADHIWERLNDDERERGKRILNDELMDRFGDRHTVPRTARHMQRQMRRMAGTRTGSRAAGVTTVWEVDYVELDRGASGEATGFYITGTQHRGDVFYDPVKFNFFDVIAAESVLFDAEQTGDVRFGPLELIDDPVETDEE
jgi:hypothetical protein